MIRATLHPRSTHTPELSLLAAQAITRHALENAATRVQRSRARLAQRLRSARCRAFSQGYQQGLAAAQGELEEIAQQVRSLYGALCMAASNDVKELVVDICEELIQREAPDILLPWLERALAILASKRSVTVQVRQRYFSSAATHLQAHHLGVQVVAAPPTQAAEFVLVTESGEISFAWRTALEELLKARITK